MLGQPALSETVEHAARQLVGLEHGANRCLVQLPLAYPNGAMVVIRVNNGGPGYTVSDAGAAFEQARQIRGRPAFGRHGPVAAQEAGIEFDGRAFFIKDVSRDQVAGAIIAVANCSQTVAILVSHRQAAADARDAEARLFERLERLFGRVETQKKIIGASGTEWTVDAQVKVDDHIAVFDAVGASKQSIYAAVAKYHDLSLLEQPPVRVAAVKSRSDLGSMLGVLSQASNVVEDITPDSTLIRVANAA